MSTSKASSENLLTASQSREQSKPAELSKKHKFIITGAIYFCYFAYGVGYSLIGATLLDVAENTNSSFEAVTKGLVVRSISYCFGSLAAGFGFNYVNRELGFAGALIGLGIAILGAPFFRNLYLYLISELFVGFCGAALDVAPNTWILEIWQTKANPPMQGMHSMYAFGQMLAPLMVEPFLSSGDQNGTGNATASNTTVSNTIVSNITEVMQNNVTDSTGAIAKPSRIFIPYFLASGILILAAVFLLVLYFKLPYLVPSNEERERKKNQSDMLSDNTKRYRTIVIILGCLLFLVYSGIEFNSFTFFIKFAVSIDLQLSKSTAAWMSGLLSLFYGLGRLGSIYVATKVRITLMLGIHLFLVGMGNLLLWIFANKSEPMIWASIIIMGYGFSSICPAFYAFLEDRIKVTSTICGWFMFFSTVSSVIISLVIGQLMDRNPLFFVYTNLVCLVFCYVVFAAFYLTDRHFKSCKKLDRADDSSAISSHSL